MKLGKANIIGNVYFHRFRMKDGSIKEVECTQGEYEALASPNPTNPTIKNGAWVMSYSNYKYDTPSGTLEDGMYADNGTTYAVKLAGKAQADVEKGEITKDALSAKALLAVQYDFITSFPTL